MFELEHEIRKWRHEMAAAGISAEVLLELEEHLREDFERAVRRGEVAGDAFRVAAVRIGRPGTLQREFDLAARASLLETLRRHCCKLTLCIGLGLAGAIGLQILRPAPYQSEAKLFVRSVIADDQFTRRLARVPDPERTKLLNQQLAILDSSELAERVAREFGPGKILQRAGGGENLARATDVIATGLLLRVPRNSDVIHLAFQHPDSAVSQGVLREVIHQFLKMHVEKFRARESGTDVIARVSNISQIQAPSPPFVFSAPLIRLQAMILAAAVLAGLVWILLVRSAGPNLRLAR